MADHAALRSGEAGTEIEAGDDAVVVLYSDSTSYSTDVREGLDENGIRYIDHCEDDPDLPLPYLAVRSLSRHMDAVYRGPDSILHDFIPVFVAASERLSA